MYVLASPFPSSPFSAPSTSLYPFPPRLIRLQIDKTTLSYAAIFGIREDLNLHGTQYSWLSALFYFGFLAWAFPTNFLMQRLPLGKYLGFNIFMWGFFLMLQAACNSFATLAVLRTLAGAAEACSDPSFMLITW
jgi:MFS family permease